MFIEWSKILYIEDISPKQFINLKTDKKIYLFGAGRTATHCIDICCGDHKIEGIIDNNSKLWGNFVEYRDQQIPVLSLSSFIKEIERQNIKNIILLITTVFYAWEIIEQLEMIPELKKLHCYLHFLLRDNSQENPIFEFSKGDFKIPKRIHYCWFGEKNIPDYLQKYLETWKKHCPDYEIIQWNETNYDINKNRYMKEAFENKKWGFVPDYARLDIIYQHGGIYLDTDVELIKPLTPLLCDKAFFGMGGNDQINLGVGFGAVPNHLLIKELRDFYDNKSFYKEDGSLNLLPCFNYQHPILKKYGFEIKNEYQNISENVVYPMEVLSPYGVCGMGKSFTKKTISIHHTELSWINEQEKRALNRIKEKLKYKNFAINP